MASRHVSIVINRWHDNVNSLFFEKEQLDPSKDTMDFIPALISSYPSYFLDLEAGDVPDFLDMLQNFDGSPVYMAKLQKYGVNRSDERFWPLYDWFQARAYEEDPIEAGLFDARSMVTSVLPPLVCTPLPDISTKLECATTPL